MPGRAGQRSRPGEVRLESVFDGRLLAGPETLQVNLANRCGLGCLFCWVHSPLRPRLSERWLAARLSDAHLAAVVEALPRLAPGRVQLSGQGEPLLHPGIEGLLETLAEARVPVSIQTGLVGGPAPERLCELGVDRLLVNLSAVTPEGFEATHPGRGRLLDGIVARLETICRRPPGERPAVTLVAVVQRTNRGELLPLVELAGRLGAAAVELKGMELADGLARLTLDAAEREAVARELELAERRAAELGVELRAAHLARFLGPRPRAGRGVFTPELRWGPCFMGWYYLRVTAAGDVMFCCKDKLVDSLDRRGLYEIWRSPAYHLLRLAGRDRDRTAGLFDAKCATCSNGSRNREVAAAVATARIGELPTGPTGREAAAT